MRPLPSLATLELALLVDPALLDLEQVGEVGVDQQLDRAERGLLAEVLDLEVFAHAAADVAAAEQDEVRVGAARATGGRAARTRR